MTRMYIYVQVVQITLLSIVRSRISGGGSWGTIMWGHYHCGLGGGGAYEKQQDTILRNFLGENIPLRPPPLSKIKP